ncbi:MAG: helix-turn-helix transcriptional regulator [Acidobacteria bacterium]|nr:helix-turn-helix transcriptional regulator [Acidobacteriota bacterium]
MPKISEQSIFKIVGLMYDITQHTAPGSWIDVYNEMADLFGSGPGGFAAFDQRNNSFSVLEGTIEQTFLDEYSNYYQHQSPLRPGIVALRPGERFNRQEIIDDKTFRKLQIYQDFYRRQGVFHLESRVFLHHAESYAGVSFSRPDRRSNFSQSELLAMTYLMPHLARSFKLYFNLLEVHRHNQVISDAFDRIPQGVLVVDSHRKPVFVNARASEMLMKGDGLKLDGKGVLEASTNDRTFHRLIAQIFDRQTHEFDRFGGVVTVERPGGSRALELMISPFTNEGFRTIGSDRLAIIFVTDPEAKTVDVAELLIEIYGLTPAEAKLAHKLAEGMSFAEACEEMSISSNTGRTHLKRVFSKTNTNRQSALIKLILTGPANIRRSIEKVSG